jgi:DNA-binding response OmpR family regulator
MESGQTLEVLTVSHRPPIRVHLPRTADGRRDELPLSLQQRAERDAALARSLRVLIVDDEQKAADSLCGVVRSWGHDARRSYDGASGLESALDHVPNVVLLALAMPGMDGYQLARRLRLHRGLKGCFLIAMRARNDRRGGRGTEADIDLFLAKPLNADVLQTLLCVEAERLGRQDQN